MPLLYHGNNLRSRITSIASPSWWRQQLSKFSSNNDDDTNKTNTSSAGTTRDWRSLSPNKPPLPFVLDHDPSGTTYNPTPLISQSSERAPKRIPIPNKYRQSHTIDGQLRKLSTIIEESDLLTEISISPRNSSSHRHRLQHQDECRFISTDNTSSTLTHHDEDRNNDITAVPSPSLPPNDSPHPSSSGSTSPALPSNDSSLHSSSCGSISPVLSPANPSLVTSSPPQSSTTQQLPPADSTSSTSSGESTTSSSSTTSFQPPPAWPIHPKTESYWSSTPSPLPTNEKKAKRKFTKMIQAAFRFRQEHQSKMPSEMETLFDSQDNVYKLQLWMHDGKIQYHSFQGDAQYIPPELSTRRAYHCDMVDVWVLGISLYRMLVGKYPFYANNDRRLFNKMQHADFGIPSHLSPDAKDLLRRMLAPEHSRASLDLVMFHPWLKPYSVIMPAFDPKVKMPLPMNIPVSSQPPRPRKKPSFVSKLAVLIIHGPFPPPKHPYRDLGPKSDDPSVFVSL